MLSFKCIGTILTAFSGLLAVAALPFEAHNLTDTAKHFLTTRANDAVPGAPRFVIYSDKFVSGQNGPPPVDRVRGYNVFALSFLLTRGPVDKAAEWTRLTDAQRATVKNQYHAAGIQIIVSLFGATDAPTSSGANALTTANNVASFIKRYNLDGVDVDYEDFAAVNARNGRAEQWLTDFTRQLRSQLPQGSFILTHAPVAPWFSRGMAYLTVHQRVGNLIDWYNIQFYNQGTTEYTTCNSLLTSSSTQSALFQIAANGVPVSKLVIGKPATTSDATNGFMPTSMLAQCLQQAKNRGWNAGVMVWQYPDAAADWIRSVRSLAFPE